MLAYFDPRKRIHLETDASKFAITAILSQFQEEGQWRPVAFWLRKLIPAETCYKTHDQELLAIVAAFKQWQHHLGTILQSHINQARETQLMRRRDAPTTHLPWMR